MEVILNFEGSTVIDVDVNEIGDEDALRAFSCSAKFDSSCPGLESDPVYNLMCLRQQQRYANDMLANRGHLFLNEVYDMLGLPRTMLGQLTGWTSKTDKAVDFGLGEDQNKNFIDGLTTDAFLAFNIDGIIII